VVAQQRTNAGQEHVGMFWLKELPATAATVEFRTIADSFKQLQMGKGDDPGGHLIVIKRSYCPFEQGIQPRVRIVVVGEANDKFAQVHGSRISLDIGSQGEMRC
jgi:hypothetical protein